MSRENTKQCMRCMEFFDAEHDSCPYCGRSEGSASQHVLHMQPGTLLNRRYIVGESLGYGSFGVTYIAWDKLMKRKVAIKEYLPSDHATRMMKSEEIVVPDDETQRQKFEKGKNKFRQEAEKLAKLGDVDGVVYVYDTFEANHTAYIVMEYLEGETLAAYLNRVGVLSEEETLDLMIPVLQALEQVHEKEIIHRDISPDNIFVVADHFGNRKVKLIDFGAARFATSSHSKSLTVLLRPGYSPEEQYRSAGEQGPHTDVYAIAAVMYQMVTGIRPVDALERRTSIERKKKDLLKAPSEYNDSLSENFETALMNALNVRIEDRTATADAFVSELISFEKVTRRGSSIRRIDFFKWPLWAKIGVPAAGVAAIALIIGLGFWISGLKATSEFVLPENYTRVVDFIGATTAGSEEQASRAYLLVEHGNAEYSPSMAADLILRQDVTAGRIVEKNTIVNLTISTGIVKYAMPDVTGLKYEKAMAAVECMGLVVHIEEADQPGLTPDCVVKQDVEPFAEVTAGDEVTLYITPEGKAKGGKVIDLCGLSYEDALCAADEKGITLFVSRKVFRRDITEPTVVKQNKTKGKMKKGESLHVVVALPWREFEMPNLLYMDKDQAVQILQNIGISPEVQESSSEVVAKGRVLAQSEASTAKVTPETTVTITVSSGSVPFEMPNVTGMTEDEARECLLEAKLGVNISYDYADGVPEGYVISQSVKVGKNVHRGDEITIVVCTAKGLAKVPNVLMMNLEEARSQLSALGFDVQIDEIFSNNEVGIVLDQIPGAGTMQIEGSTVILTVSKGEDPAIAQARAEAAAAAEKANEKTDENPKEDQNEQPVKEPERTWHASDWTNVNNVPAGVEIIEGPKTQYNYHTVKTATGDSPEMDGYELTGSNFGSWYDVGWFDSEQNDTDSTRYRKVGTEYRWRCNQTKTSTSAEDGWSVVDVVYTDWSSNQTSTSNPGSGDTVRVTDTQKRQVKWAYFHYGNTYSSGSYGVDSIPVGTNHCYHEISQSSPLSAINDQDQGGQQMYQGPSCSSSNWSGWFRDSSKDVYETTYTYQTRSIDYYVLQRTSETDWTTTDYSGDSDYELIDVSYHYEQADMEYCFIKDMGAGNTWGDYDPSNSNPYDERQVVKYKVYD